MGQRIALTLGCILIWASVRGQQLHFQSYYFLKKNEPVQVNAMLQDRTGFLWFGTDRGVFRFDGIDISKVTMDSLSDIHVTALEEDSLGRIWMGHQNGQLSILDNGKMLPFNPSEGSAAGEISDILFDRAGRLWFSTLNDGLYYFMNDRLFRLDENEGMPDLFVYEMVEDDKGQIWAGTDGGIVVCRLKDQKPTLITLTEKNGLPDNIIKGLEFANGKIWIATEDKGIVSVSGELEKPVFAQLIPGTWEFGSVTDFQFHENEIWISSWQTGLIRYDLVSSDHQLFRSPELASIRKLNADVEGNIWIGTKTGLLRTPGSTIELMKDVSKDNNVIALTVDAKNNLWFSTSEGLFKFNMDKMGHGSYDKFPLPSHSVGSGIISLHCDDSGIIWAGLYGSGVLMINPETHAVRQINKELRNGSVLNITSKENQIWLATLGGATRISKSGERLDITNFGQVDGLISDYIYQVFVDSRNRTWFATDRAGIDMLDAEGFHHFKESLASKVVYGLAETQDHQILANVQGEGLFRFDPSGFKAVSMPLNSSDQNINVLSIDATGHLVMAHDLGIDIWDLKAGKIRSIGEEAGIQDMHPNLNALAIDKQGRLWIGTDNGIIRYSPTRSESLMPAPRPLIEGMKINDTEVPMESGMRLAYDENTVALNYVGFWYQNPASILFQYRLDGHDRDWISSRDRTVIYSSLPPGKYTFRLRVSASEDFQDARESALDFVIRPPFWRTVWFYILALIAASFAGYSFILYRERALRKDKAELEERVAERTREIQAKNDEIQAQNEEIQSQSEQMKGINENLEDLVRKRTAELHLKNTALEEYAFINAHKLRSPVASILGLIHLIQMTKLDVESKEIITHLEDSARKLDGVVTTITEAIERGHMDMPGQP